MADTRDTGRRADDREDIRDLCARYAIALDERDWAGLDGIFARDAVMTFAHIGDVTGPAAIAETCGAALDKLDASQHLIGTVLPAVTGDGATCTSYFQAQHVRSGTDGGDHLLVAGRYDDELARGPHGWRITHRRQSVTWTSGNNGVVF